ncbi:MAG: signal peptidase I [Mycobacteriales bacterium]
MPEIRPHRRTPRTSLVKGAPIPRGKHKANKRRSAWVELPILILVAVLVALLVRSLLLQTFYIPSGSMENTLLVGDRVLVNKVIYKFRDPARGEVVVFTPPNVWVQRSNQDDFIKRIIGIGGDRVVCCDTAGRITINGYALEEDYLYPGNVPSQAKFDVTVPRNRYFVMGDHRGMSGDSRVHLDFQRGTIPRSAIVGRAFAIYWPVGRIDNLPVPKTLRQVPDPAGE